ncbi:molybdopterin-dependent oxidoreductase [Halostreptopolyspora alba]|uniref:Molybdopterin-binding oxidoreductase n=1 Tax=Halostreptopolyspora alba TaxID=2487137 RepID=A0A3N0EBA9_9ACTN|nr:molybdopterin-binding oxidoreductase [Nocardiopsaceae bacterium YIM 96095]
MAVAEVGGALTGPEATPLLAVGDAVVDLVPQPVKELAIALFGTADKVVLLGGMGVVLAGVAAGIGSLARGRRWIGDAGIALFGAIGVLAALTRPDSGPLDALPSLVGAAAAVGTLRLLLALAPEAPAAATPTGPMAGDTASGFEDGDGHGEPRARVGFDRRRFVAVAGATAALSGAVGTGARWYSSSRVDPAGTREAVSLPRPASPAPPLADGVELDVADQPPFFTPNEDFYRIDTVLSVPRIDARAWRLRVHGRGVTEREYTFDDLLNRSDLAERDITLACVSNQVGGSLVGNARWIGVPLAGLLREVGVRPPDEGGPADQLVSRSSDGMTIGTPVSDVMDGRDAMLALGMNGEPLPVRHGFPLRMVVPGLYGYVSACKWLVELELTTFDAFDAYWVPRGWSREAPVKTQSRIDTPGGADTLDAGTVTVAGVAWAQNVGIENVEVRVDEGVWHEATLAAEDTADTWRQWTFEWDASPGEHRLTVRATDRDGRTQTAEEAPPSPNGATGHHSVDVTVAS